MINQIILSIVCVGLVIGAADTVIGNKWGLADSFKEGFASFASLAVTMTGITVLVPLINAYMAPLIAPVYELIGADPAVFAGSLLANDMGGYQLAQSMAKSKEAADFCGMILASMLGASIVFNIPVSMSIIKADDRPYMAKGVLCGIITIPIGCLAGGLTAGYGVPFLLINLLPISAFSAFIAITLFFFPKTTVRVFIVFGKIIEIIALTGTVTAIITALTGFTVIPGEGSVYDALATVSSIVIVLPGTYVIIALIKRFASSPLAAAGKKLGINTTSALGFLTSSANAVPTFNLIKDMDVKGKMLNFAFLTGAGYMLGDHLAFCGAVNKELIIPMIIAKLTAGVFGVLLALLINRDKNAN